MCLIKCPRIWERPEKSPFKYCYKSTSYGGGGGNRTRVRKSSAFSSTCIALSFEFNCGSSDGQDDTQRFPEFRAITRDRLGR